MKSQLGNPEYVFLFWIDINVVGWAGKRRRLDQGANCSRIVTLDLALVFRTKAFELAVVSGELATAAADVQGVAADEFLLARILQVLPARHPRNRGIGDVVRSGRLAQQLWQVSIARAAVQVIAQIAAQLSAGICDSGGPVTGLRIQHDVRGLDAGSREHNHLGVDFHFFFRCAVDVGHAFRRAVFIDNHGAH